MVFPGEIQEILNDRESGSVALLNRLVSALERELRKPEVKKETFTALLTGIRRQLEHFAAIENFLTSLAGDVMHNDLFPETALEFIRQYRVYWSDSGWKIAAHFLRHCHPEGKTILTHSHSQTVISLLEQLHAKQFRFSVLQTLSSPGEEGRVSVERMHAIKIAADLIGDAGVPEALGRTGLVVVGCDALLATEFLNKTGTRRILEHAKELNIPCIIVAESRKKITRAAWKRNLKVGPLFEWIPLSLANLIVFENGVV